MKGFATSQTWSLLPKMRVEVVRDISRSARVVELRWLNTVLAVCVYMSFAKSWQQKGCRSQAESWQVKTILVKDFDCHRIRLFNFHLKFSLFKIR